MIPVYSQGFSSFPLFISRLEVGSPCDIRPLRTRFYTAWELWVQHPRYATRCGPAGWASVPGVQGRGMVWWPKITFLDGVVVESSVASASLRGIWLHLGSFHRAQWSFLVTNASRNVPQKIPTKSRTESLCHRVNIMYAYTFWTLVDRRRGR